MEKSGDTGKAICEIMNSIVYDVMSCCGHVSYGDVECIVNHIEALSRGQLVNYLPRKLREVYNSLSDEDKNLVMLAIRERLEKHVKNLCDKYRYLYQQLGSREGNDICNSL